MPRKASIHQSPEERQAATSAAMLEAIKGIPAPDNDPILRKLEEIKSAALITNRNLKGAQKIEIKGDKGEPGKDGNDGPPGPPGRTIIGPQGPAGKDGKDGKDGQTIVGTPGKDGMDGKDGSPDTPDQVVAKVNLATVKIDPKQVKGLERALREIDAIGTNPQGMIVGGGANPLKMQAAGVDLGAFITTINFSSNLTAVYSGNGVVTLTASAAAAGSFTELSATETPNGVNKVFTFSSATAQPSYIILDNVWVKATTKSGTVNWTWSAGAKQATLTVAPTDELYAIV